MNLLLGIALLPYQFIEDVLNENFKLKEAINAGMILAVMARYADNTLGTEKFDVLTWAIIQAFAVKYANFFEHKFNKGDLVKVGCSICRIDDVLGTGQYKVTNVATNVWETIDFSKLDKYERIGVSCEVESKK